MAADIVLSQSLITTSGLTNVTQSVVIDSSWSNTLLVVGGMVVGDTGSPGALSSMTYDGAGMTVLDNTELGTPWSYWWNVLGVLWLPNTGTKNLYVQWASNGKLLVEILVVKNVDHTSPHYGSLASGTSDSINVTSVVDDLVYDLSVQNDDTDITVDGTQTQYYPGSGGAGYGETTSSVKIANSTTTAMVMTLSGAQKRHVGFSIHSAPGGGNPVSVTPYIMVFERWRKRLYNKLIQQGAVPLGRRGLVTI
jgi:hypothetical protein